MSEKYDLVIIGSGPAGVNAAIQAAKLGKRVCVVERYLDNIGGAWIQTGTLPSKTLREVLAMTSSVRVHSGRQWSQQIVENILAGKLFDRAKEVSQRQERHVRRYLAKNGVALIGGSAFVRKTDTVEVSVSPTNKQTLQTAKILLATGSKPRRPDWIPFDGWRVVDADEILRLEHAPKRILIYGAGVIGCEYACVFAALGVETVIADSRPCIMPDIDREIATELQDSMAAGGIKFLLNKELVAIKPQGLEVNATLDTDVYTIEVLFFAAGRKACSDNLWHSELEIETDKRGTVQVDKGFQTTVTGIYAAGDIIGSPALAATAAHQGRVAASNALGATGLSFPTNFPVGVYTIPELSSVGCTEEQLLREGVPYVVGRAGYREIARGYIRGDSHGKLKLLICRRTHRLIGVHIVGEGACELIHIGMVFMQQGCYAQDLLNIVYNYPTLAEGYKIAAFNALNKIFPGGIIGPPPNVSDPS